MVVSLHNGDPNIDPKYYGPYYGDPLKKVPLVLGNSYVGLYDGQGSPAPCKIIARSSN